MRKQAEADFLGWVSTSRDGLRKTAYLLCGDWFLADDLVQDALTRLYGVWGRVAGSGDPGPYARKILLYLYLDHRRLAARREVPSAQVPDAVVEQPKGVDGDRDRLMAALARVPKGQRAVLVLRYWEDLSIEQTAQALGTTPSNVRSQASRGLNTLRAALDADPDDDRRGGAVNDIDVKELFASAVARPDVDRIDTDAVLRGGRRRARVRAVATGGSVLAVLALAGSLVVAGTWQPAVIGEPSPAPSSSAPTQSALPVTDVAQIAGLWVATSVAGRDVTGYQVREGTPLAVRFGAQDDPSTWVLNGWCGQELGRVTIDTSGQITSSHLGSLDYTSCRAKKDVVGEAALAALTAAKSATISSPGGAGLPAAPCTTTPGPSSPSGSRTAEPNSSKTPAPPACRDAVLTPGGSIADQDAVDAVADRVRAEAEAQPTDNLSGIVVHPDARAVDVLWVGPVPASLTKLAAEEAKQDVTINFIPARYTRTQMLAAADKAVLRSAAGGRPGVAGADGRFRVRLQRRQRHQGRDRAGLQQPARTLDPARLRRRDSSRGRGRPRPRGPRMAARAGDRLAAVSSAADAEPHRVLLAVLLAPDDGRLWRRPVTRDCQQGVSPCRRTPTLAEPTTRADRLSPGGFCASGPSGHAAGDYGVALVGGVLVAHGCGRRGVAGAAHHLGEGGAGLC